MIKDGEIQGMFNLMLRVPRQQHICNNEEREIVCYFCVVTRHIRPHCYRMMHDWKKIQGCCKTCNNSEWKKETATKEDLGKKRSATS